jgi:hypothetical protein
MFAVLSSTELVNQIFRTACIAEFDMNCELIYKTLHYIALHLENNYVLTKTWRTY